jgi:hypothetical protein
MKSLSLVVHAFPSDLFLAHYYTLVGNIMLTNHVALLIAHLKHFQLKRLKLFLSSLAREKSTISKILNLLIKLLFSLSKLKKSVNFFTKCKILFPTKFWYVDWTEWTA